MNYIQYMQTPFSPILSTDGVRVEVKEPVQPIVHPLSQTRGYLTWAANKTNPNVEDYEKFLQQSSKGRPVISQGREMTEEERRASQQKLELYGQLQKEEADRKKAAEVVVEGLNYFSPSYWANKHGADLNGAESFLFDIAADPTTYLSMGILPVVKQAGKKATKEVVEKVAKEAVEKTLKEGTEKTAKEAVSAQAQREVGDIWERIKLFNDERNIDGVTMEALQSDPDGFLARKWASVVKKHGDVGDGTAPLVYKGKPITVDPKNHSITTMPEEDFQHISRKVTTDNADHPNYNWEAGDVNDAAYFEMTPAEVAFMKKADYLAMPEGSRVVMFSDEALSTDSYPLLISDIARKHGKQGVGFFDQDGTKVVYQRLNKSGRPTFEGLDDEMQRAAMVQRLQQSVDRATSALGGPQLKVVYNPVDDSYYVPNIGFKKGAGQPVVDPKNNRMHRIYDHFRNSNIDVDWDSFFKSVPDLAAMAEHKARQTGGMLDIDSLIKELQGRASAQYGQKVDFGRILQQERERFAQDFGQTDWNKLYKDFVSNNVDFQRRGGQLNYLNYSR